MTLLVLKRAAIRTRFASSVENGRGDDHVKDRESRRSQSEQWWSAIIVDPVWASLILSASRDVQSIVAADMLNPTHNFLSQAANLLHRRRNTLPDDEGTPSSFGHARDFVHNGGCVLFDSFEESMKAVKKPRDDQRESIANTPYYNEKHTAHQQRLENVDEDSRGWGFLH